MWILSPTGPHTHSKINGSHRGLLSIRAERSAAFGKRGRERVCNFVSLSLSLSFSQPDLSSEECYVSACLQKKRKKKVYGMIWKHSPLKCYNDKSLLAVFQTCEAGSVRA